MAAHDLETLAGVGPATAQALVAAGFADRESVASATVEQLIAVRGFAEARATALIAAARSGGSLQLDGPSEATVQEEAHTDPEHPKRSDKLRKKHKKLRARYVDLKQRSKKARKKSKTASSKKKRKRWAAEADRLEKKAKKAKKRLARQA